LPYESYFRKARLSCIDLLSLFIYHSPDLELNASDVTFRDFRQSSYVVPENPLVAKMIGAITFHFIIQCPVPYAANVEGEDIASIKDGRCFGVEGPRNISTSEQVMNLHINCG
jgi:hypothetical protein